MAVNKGNTIIFENKPVIIGTASVVGKKEGEGPYGNGFDVILDDSRFDESSFEKAESKMQREAVKIAVSKAGKKAEEIDLIAAGDLLNQCMGSFFALEDFNSSVLGLYGACSTLALVLNTVSALIDGKGVKTAVAVTSSHFCSAERQYRYPLEYGSLRTPTSQWTVTGAGAFVLSNEGDGPYIHSCLFGQIIDMKVTDQNNMGAAMAPAAADTLTRYFKDTNTLPNDYDIIFTGDLGFTGTALLYTLMEESGFSLEGRHTDFGKMIFDKDRQEVMAGGSGCGCSAVMMASYVMEKFKEGVYKNILFCATGALLSPTSVLQKESIPAIAHLVNIRM